MFFKHKAQKQEEALNRLEARLDTLTQNAAAREQKLDAVYTLLCGQNDTGSGFQPDVLMQSVGRLNDVNANMLKLLSSVQTLGMSVEDMLEGLEEKQSEEAAVRQQLHMHEQTEQALLNLFVSYQEQFWIIKRFFQAETADETWLSQLALMEKNIEHYRHLCGISIIQECGIPVDYDLHEIIEVIRTEDSSKDQTIAEIYSFGYIYQGTVRKKASAAAYRTENRRKQ